MRDKVQIKAWHICILVLASLLAYTNAIPAGLVYDDHILIEQNPRVTGEMDWRTRLIRIFQTNYWGEVHNDGLYRPVTTLTFALDHAIFGGDPAAYHAINVLLHASAVIALYFLLVALFGNPGLAMAASLIFSVHPVHTEAVTGVVGRPEVLSCLFVILAIRFALPPVSANRLGFSLVFFLLALLTKENSIVLLGLYPLAMSCGSGESKMETLRAGLVALVGFALVAVLWFILRRLVIGSFLTPAGYEPIYLVNPIAHVGGAERWATAMVGLGRHLRLLLLPVGLTADYSFAQIPIRSGFFEIPVMLSCGAMIALALAAALAWRRAPAVAFGIGWFLMSVLPTSNLLFPIGTIYAERFLYLPSAGFCLLASWILHSACSTRRRGRTVWAVSIAGIAVIFAGLTADRNRDWKDDASLFTSVIRNAPRSAKGHYELAVVREKEGDEKEAIRLYWKATEIYPEYAEAHYNRAGIYRRQSKFEFAIADYLSAVRAEPDFAEAHHNLGLCFALTNEIEAAEESLREAVRLDPDLTEAVFDLSVILNERGHPQEATDVLESYFERNPSDARGHLRAALIYVQALKDREKALHHIKRARQIDPDLPELEGIDPDLFEPGGHPESPGE